MRVIRISKRFEQPFLHEQGWTFNATMQPVEDAKIYNDDYFPIRQILRVFPSEPWVDTGCVIQDVVGQRYILGEYDFRPDYRAFRMYPVNDRMVWTRQSQTADPLTGMKKGSKVENLGVIWCLSEVIAREARGGDIKTREEIHRVVTGASVELDDSLNNQRVVKLNPSLGVRILEIQ